MILGFSLIFLASCSKPNNLDGKYYNIYDGNAKLILEINGDSGKFYKEGTHAITIYLRIIYIIKISIIPLGKNIFTIIF